MLNRKTTALDESEDNYEVEWKLSKTIAEATARKAKNVAFVRESLRLVES